MVTVNGIEIVEYLTKRYSTLREKESSKSYLELIWEAL